MSAIADFCPSTNLIKFEVSKIMSHQQQYEDYLKGFTRYLDKLVNKVSLFTYLMTKSKGDEVELAPVLFLSIRESLLVDSVLSLAKLYEVKSDRNLDRFLNFVEGNLKSLVWQNTPVTREQIADQRELIKSREATIKNILSQRVKFYAHHDKEYFVENANLDLDYPITVDDVEELIRIAQKINCDHNLALTGKMPMTLHEFHVMSLDNIFQILRDHRSQLTSN